MTTYIKHSEEVFKSVSQVIIKLSPFPLKSDNLTTTNFIPQMVSVGSLRHKVVISFRTTVALIFNVLPHLHPILRTCNRGLLPLSSGVWPFFNSDLAKTAGCINFTPLLFKQHNITKPVGEFQIPSGFFI